MIEMKNTKSQTYKIIDYKPQVGYPNAKRVSLFFWECQGCGKNKMDIDLYQDTGLCGNCQFKQWDYERSNRKRVENNE